MISPAHIMIEEVYGHVVGIIFKNQTAYIDNLLLIYA